jgi:hypothetical protein
MDRERFDHLLAAYGADLARWPAHERAAAMALAAQHGELAAALEEARALDRALDAARNDDRDYAALGAHILSQAPRAAPWFDSRAMIALAACAVFGMLIGYGGGRLTPVDDVDDAYFSAAFEAPFLVGEEG